jgi:hypothetical protein
MSRNQPIGKMTSYYDIVLFDQVSQSTASAFEAIKTIKIHEEIKKNK